MSATGDAAVHGISTGREYDAASMGVSTDIVVADERLPAERFDETSIATLRWYHVHGRSAWYAIERRADGAAIGWIADSVDPARDRLGTFRPEAIERMGAVALDRSFAPASLREIRLAHAQWDAADRYASALPRRTWLRLGLLLLLLLALLGAVLYLTDDAAPLRGPLVVHDQTGPRVVVHAAIPRAQPPARGGPSRVIRVKRPVKRAVTPAATPSTPSAPAPSQPAPARRPPPSRPGCGVYSGSPLCG
jgi:hypothetical protein